MHLLVDCEYITVQGNILSYNIILCMTFWGDFVFKTASTKLFEFHILHFLYLIVFIPDSGSTTAPPFTDNVTFFSCIPGYL